MFKKSSKTKELGLFSSPSMVMCKRESDEIDDPMAWHNQFFKNVTSKIDEEIFRPLYVAGMKGAPTKDIRMLCAMRILKEGARCNDVQLYENIRFNLVWRRALGIFDMSEQCPSIDSYYTFFRRIQKFEDEDESHENLFKKAYKQVTAKQIREYNISGRAVRMDSKLIGSNIAWFSRYEIIHETFMKCVTQELIQRISEQMIRQKAEEFFAEDASKTVYYTEDETLTKRLLDLGIVINAIIKMLSEQELPLLRRVFNEQYEVSEDGTVTVRDKKLISANSVQNPHDPDAAYRGKNGKKVKGYSTNITETCDEKDKPSLITDVQVKPATAADNGFLEDALNETKEVTGHKVDKVHADGAYQSKENRELAAKEDNGFEFIANGIQGKPARYDLHKNEDGTLSVTDKKTGEVQTAINVSEGRWKIPVTDKDGNKTYRYFDEAAVERSEVRQRTESIPWEERKKRNNVEASIFQYCFHTRNNKTRYRGLFKHTLQALSRCLWVNMRRLFIYDTKLALQRA